MTGEGEEIDDGLGGHEKRWEGEVVARVWEKMGEREEVDDGIKKNDFWLSDYHLKF